MIFVRPDRYGIERLSSLYNVYTGTTVILMGGAPSIKEQPLHLLEQRGVLTGAINNAAIHFRPSLWFSGDNPESFARHILYDPTIRKFAPANYSNNEIDGKKYGEYPEVYFYPLNDKPLVGDMLNSHMMVNWYKNTLYAAICILYNLGCRRIILGGCDFGFDKNVYAHPDGLTFKEREANKKLYDSQVFDLVRLADTFESAGLELMDCSVNSRLAGTYPHMTMEEAVQMCLEGFPDTDVDTAKLKHGTRFMPKKLRKHFGLDDDFDMPSYDEEGMELII